MSCQRHHAGRPNNAKSCRAAVRRREHHSENFKGNNSEKFESNSEKFEGKVRILDLKLEICTFAET